MWFILLKIKENWRIFNKKGVGLYIYPLCKYIHYVNLYVFRGMHEIIIVCFEKVRSQSRSKPQDQSMN